MRTHQTAALWASLPTSLCIAAALTATTQIATAQQNTKPENDSETRIEICVEPGTFTIEAALQQARLARLHGEAAPDATITLRLAEGTYALCQPIVLRPEDSHTTITSDGEAIITGGVCVKGWKKQNKKGKRTTNVWEADIPVHNGRQLLFRQMWVNSVKAIRARDVEDWEQMNRILNMDKKTETLIVPSAAVAKLVSNKTKETAQEIAPGAEMVLHEMWCVANLRIREVTLMGDSAAVRFHQPESHVHFAHPWPSPMVTTNGRNSAFYLTGAAELLDSPGEWHADERAGKIYYIPRDGEDLTTAQVVVPAVETLLQVCGTPDEPVHDVLVEDLTFCHATWTRPSLMGHAPLQAGMYMTEAYKIRPQISRPNGDHKLDNQGWVGRPAAAITATCAQRVTVSDCSIEHCASTGVDFGTFCQDCRVGNCTISDCGGTGILAGSFGPEGLEAHKPYDPADRREVCRGMTIAFNTVTNVGNEDWGTVGIGAGYVRDIVIEGNEVADVPYTGISMGWGWNQQPCAMANNKVINNNIHHFARHMYDVAAIYTLGAQPHSLIEGNVVGEIYRPGYVHDPEHWFWLYTDEGSSGIRVRNNRVASDKFLKNSCGPGNEWENNGPDVKQEAETK